MIVLNVDRTDKWEYLDTFEKFKELCIAEYNKMDHYKRQEYIELAYKILNDNKFKIKITEKKIKNMIVPGK